MSTDRQNEILSWAQDTFGPIAAEPLERTMRFVEEAIELAHAMKLDQVVLQNIIKRIWARDPGDVPREIGQAQMTLEAFAEVLGYSASEECESEFRRVRSIPKAEWQRRHAAKTAIGITM